MVTDEACNLLPPGIEQTEVYVGGIIYKIKCGPISESECQYCREITSD
jgi:hypothetical protein